MKIFTILLLCISGFLSIKHGWDSFQPANPEQAQMLTELGLSKAILPYTGVFLILVGIMLFFPQTFFLGNLLNAFIILVIMALALNAGNIRIALMEIPFLAMPLLLIWLKYPFKF